MDVLHHHPVFTKDTSKYWYRPTISREDAILLLHSKPPGYFVIRDSNSYPGAYGLALKVSHPPPGVTVKSTDGTELVRHFLIESTNKGVRLKGCSNEPVFGSLAALVYQHSITPLALPCKLTLSQDDSLDPFATGELDRSTAALLEHGAACNVLYLHSCNTESLTGPQALRKTLDEAYKLSAQAQLVPFSAHFKVTKTGITLTDNTRQRFFRRHYATSILNYCGLDPEDRKWSLNSAGAQEACGSSVTALSPDYPAQIFGFVAKSLVGQTGNTCHVFCEIDTSQPASAIVTFVTKVLMGGGSLSSLHNSTNGVGNNCNDIANTNNNNNINNNTSKRSAIGNHHAESGRNGQQGGLVMGR